MDERTALLRLSLIPGLGPRTIAILLEKVRHPAEVFGLGMGRLVEIDGIGPERARRICDPRGAEALADEQAACAAAQVRIVVRGDADYPQALNALSDAPIALWMRGSLEPRDRLALAIVGPRRPSAYAHRQARRLATKLAGLGASIVSGMARGIDTVAHEAALEAGGGRTIGVLGSGLGHFYPEENLPLAERVAAGRGAVLSEFPLRTKPHAGHFPRRNRIIAALALGVLVAEASKRSGALITARLAMDMGREVLVMPGQIDKPECAGSNQLIRDGATLITGWEDVLEEIEPLATLAKPELDNAKPEPLRASALSSRERQLYTLLDDSARSVDDLVRVADLPPSAVAATMLSLELRGLVRKSPGGYTRAL